MGPLYDLRVRSPITLLLFLASHCRISILRLLVHLADGENEWATEISSVAPVVPLILRQIAAYGSPASSREIQLSAPDSSSVVDDNDDDANRLDVMCLALALLTTLVGESEDVRRAVFRTSKWASETGSMV